jgi:hypothetical protein
LLSAASISVALSGAENASPISAQFADEPRLPGKLVGDTAEDTDIMLFSEPVPVPAYMAKFDPAVRVAALNINPIAKYPPPPYVAAVVVDADELSPELPLPTTGVGINPVISSSEKYILPPDVVVVQVILIEPVVDVIFAYAKSSCPLEVPTILANCVQV